MTSMRNIFIWGALQCGNLVAGDVFQQSRVLINASSPPSTTLPSTTVFINGWPTHGPIFPSTFVSTDTIVATSGTSGSDVNSPGEPSTVSRSFTLSPVGISKASPTSTESPLPWTGRVITSPSFQTSSTIVSSITSTTLLPSTTSSFPQIVSNSSNYANETSRASPGLSTPQLTPTSSIGLATGNLSISYMTTSVTSSLASSASATYTLFNNVSTCSTLLPEQPVTIWSILPNTTTTTLTVTGNWSTSFTPLPEFTPPVYCPTFTPSAIKTSTDPTVSSNSVPSWVVPSYTKTTNYLTESVGLSSTLFIPAPASTNSGRVTVTSVTTSKNGITEITSVTLPDYGSATGKTDKLTVDPSTIPSDTLQWSPQTEPSRSRAPTASALTSDALGSSPPPANAPTPVTTIYAGDPAATTPITEVVKGITVIVDPTKAIIGSSTIKIGPAPQTVSVSGNIFTVLPNEIDGPSVIISIPTYTPGGVFAETPTTTTTINGVSIGLGAGGGSSVVIGGTSFNIGPNALQQTIVNNGQTIAIGSKGIIFASTTIVPPSFAITPPPNPNSNSNPTTPTNIAIIDGSIITAIGPSLAIINGQTLTYGPSVPQTTTIFNGETITLSPQGIIFHGSTIGGPDLSSASSRIGIVGGISVTEIGSTLAVISGATFTIGPNATPTSTIINNQLVSAGPGGFSDGSFFWNPFATATPTPTALPDSASTNSNPAVQVLTAQGIIFTEISNSLVVIGTRTFTFGPGAKTTTDIVDGQTVSIGPSGIGFASTTFTSLPTAMKSSSMASATNPMGAASSSSSSEKPQTTGKNNAAVGARPAFGVLGVGVGVLGALCVGWGF